MTKIVKVFGKQITDSKNRPTIEVVVELENGLQGVAGVPSGASTGTREVIELRDINDGVKRAIGVIEGEISQMLAGMEVSQQTEIDQKMIKADGTVNLARLGGNSVVGTSIAICKAAAADQGVPVYRYINSLLGMGECKLPKPMFLMMEGGRHGDWATDIQEFMVMAAPGLFINFETELTSLTKIFEILETILQKEGLNYKVGYEGALVSDRVASNRSGLKLIRQAVIKAGFEPGRDMVLGVDVAASEFFHKEKYLLRGSKRDLSPDEWKKEMIKLVDEFKLGWVEDPFDQQAWIDWIKLQKILGENCRLIGDDLVVTRKNLIKKATKRGAVGGVIIKPNQVGTITDTLASVREAKRGGLWVIVSHRGGETKDEFIADLGVGVGAQAGKFGGAKQKERQVKYQRLQEIADELNGKN